MESHAKQPWAEVRSSWTWPHHQPVPSAAPALGCSRQAPASPSVLCAGQQLLPVMIPQAPGDLPPLEPGDDVAFHPPSLELKTLGFAKTPSLAGWCLGLGTRVTAAWCSSGREQRSSKPPGCSLRLPGAAVPTGCAAGRAPQAPSTRSDIRDCSADPPVSPALLPLPAPGTPGTGFPPVPARLPVPPVPATDGHQHDGASGLAAGHPADPRRPRLHRALHGCPHGKVGVPRTPGDPLPAHNHLSRLHPGSRANTSPSGTPGWAGSLVSPAPQVRPSPKPSGRCSGGWHPPAGSHSWGSVHTAWSHSLRAAGGPCRLQGQRKR